MREHVRALGLVGALVLLVAVDAVIARVNLFAALLPDSRPTSLFSGINYQMTEILAALHGGPIDPRPAVFMGNSQMDALIYPLSRTAEVLQRAGAPRGTRAFAFTIFGTAPTDAEVLSRDIDSLRPGVVVFGLSAPDVGTTLERAREMPVTHNLDVGWRDGLVPPADLEARLERWARTGWRLYRYRRFFRDLLIVPDEPRTPAALLEIDVSERESYERMFGRERADQLMALRGGFERAERFEDVERFIRELRGPDYLTGLRERWRTVDPQALQLEALRRAAEQVRRGGGRPVWLLIPENPAFELDPEIGAEVRRRSDQAAEAVRAAAAQSDVPVLDVRRTVPARRFQDLNHTFRLKPSELLEPVAAELAARGLLTN
jgi:hypothetical protein